MSTDPAGFREFVEARSSGLLRTAWMLTGDAATAEDLLQTALARTWPHWDRVCDGGNPEAYVRTVLVRLNASWRRRLWNREHPSDDPAKAAAERPGEDEHRRTDDRSVLIGALSTLPLRQRQAVVLRYFDDLSVETVADVMGTSPGTVKSQSAKALLKLREAIGPTLVDQEET